MTHITVTAGLDLMGFDFYVEADVEITHFGCEAKLYGPPENCYPAEAPEWFPHSFTLQRDEPGELGPKWKIEPDTYLFDAIAAHPAVDGACHEAVCLEASERRWMQRQSRRRRAF